MAIVSVPGKSFAEMSGLIDLHAPVFAPLLGSHFTKQTFLSIFWEETLFNNILQNVAGNAVGFGQAEPGEFWRFNAKGTLSQRAKDGNYLVYDLPRIDGKKLIGTLNDYQAVHVSCALVRDLYQCGLTSKDALLNAYGGVGFTGPQPDRLAAPGGRLSVIAGIKACDDALVAAGDDQSAILKALKLARNFNDDAGFSSILFPGGSDAPMWV